MLYILRVHAYNSAEHSVNRWVSEVGRPSTLPSRIEIYDRISVSVRCEMSAGVVFSEENRVVGAHRYPITDQIALPPEIFFVCQ